MIFLAQALDVVDGLLRLGRPWRSDFETELRFAPVRKDDVEGSRFEVREGFRPGQLASLSSSRGLLGDLELHLSPAEGELADPLDFDGLGNELRRAERKVVLRAFRFLHCVDPIKHLVSECVCFTLIGHHPVLPTRGGHRGRTSDRTGDDVRRAPVVRHVELQRRVGPV
ncbi:MAG: hypothetical protein ACJ77I_00620 [Chloroflexota bacterium]